VVRAGAEEAGRPAPEIAARLYVCPTTDAERVRAIARRSIAAYFNVPTYRAHQQWLGHGDLFAPLWRRWEEGDRTASSRALPAARLDAKASHGRLGSGS